MTTLFPGKNNPNRAQSNHIFHGKGRENWALLMPYADISVAKFFLIKMLFFSVLAISMGKRGIKVQPEVQTMGMFSVAKMEPTGMLVCFHTSKYALHVYFLFSYDHKTSSLRLPLLFFIDWFELFHRLIMNNVDYLGSSGSIELVLVHLVLF